MTPRDEEVVSVTRGAISCPFNIQILEVFCEVSLVGQGEGARLQLLVELSPTEAVLLVNADGVVQVIQLPGVS